MNRPCSLLANVEDQAVVWRFPLEVSQSSLGGRTILSNACTLIALKLAENIHLHNIQMPHPFRKNVTRKRKHATSSRRDGGADVLSEYTLKSPRNKEYDPIRTKCPMKVMGSMVNGIIEGNHVYDQHAGETSKRVYNLPEAITACRETFQEVDFTLVSDNIEQSLPKMLRAAISCSEFHGQRRLFLVIIGCVRTILLVYQRDTRTITLFDTHMHTVAKDGQPVQEGAIIATSAEEDIKRFATWIRWFIFPDAEMQEKKEFEISLVRYVGEAKVSGCQADHVDSSFTKIDIFSKFNMNVAEPPEKQPRTIDYNNNDC